MPLKELAESLRPAFIKTFAKNSFSPCCLFLSASDMEQKAYVRHAVAEESAKAWEEALTALEETWKKNAVFEPTILRADWVTAAEEMTWERCLELVKVRRFNWFRRGIALDLDYKIAFMDQEINANLFFAAETKEKNPCFSPGNATKYCKRRFGCDWPEISLSDKIIAFDANGVFIQKGMPQPLTSTGFRATAVHRDTADINDKDLLDIIKTSTNYLVRQCGKDGKFVYGLFPCDDSVVPSYNIHRHFGTLFSMADAYALYEDSLEKQAIIDAVLQGFKYGIETSAIFTKTADGEDVICFKERNATDIGMSGLALLAFTKYTEVTDSDEFVPVMNAIARGITSVFQKPDGTFTQQLNTKDFSVKKEFIVTFYDGEALFALLRLYAITKDENLLNAVEKAVNRFNELNYWEHHDHWMGYVLNELSLWRPEKKYFKFGLDNILSTVPKMDKTNNPAPTRLEMIMATENMIRRMKSLPEMHELSEQVDFVAFYSTISRYAERLLNNYFYPEVAMFFQNPQKILGGFFARTDKFRIRIDDVQHTVSGFISYYKYLNRKTIVTADVSSISKKSEEKFSSADNIPTEKISIDSLQRMVVEAKNISVTFETSKPLSTIPIITSSPQYVDMLRVGVMKKVHPRFWEKDNVRFPMFCMAKQFNVDLFYFNPQDIDFTNKTVKALFLENGVKVQKNVPLPKIVDNDMTMFRGETGLIMQKLKKYCYLIRPFDNTMHKKKFFDTLSKEGSFREFLIETHMVNDLGTFLPLLEKYDNDVILKPLNGVGGTGVDHVTRDDSKFIVNLKTDIYSFEDVSEFSKFYKDNFTQKKYILQPYIRSCTRHGNPFDVRISARRGAEGKFVSLIYPRIGDPDGVVSNVAKGGYSMDIEAFLNIEFGNDGKIIYNKLVDFGNKFPDYYQTFFPEIIADIGIDVGIQKRGSSYDLKVFEAYSQPGFKIVKNEVALINFAYYKYLDKKLKDGSLKIG